MPTAARCRSESRSALPKLVTAEDKEHGWVELGKELMSCFGWRVRIELG
jgi:hypothetical protein